VTIQAWVLLGALLLILGILAWPLGLWLTTVMFRHQYQLATGNWQLATGNWQLYSGEATMSYLPQMRAIHS
jgi:K+-transporting ATPase A subunit